MLFSGEKLAAEMCSIAAKCQAKFSQCTVEKLPIKIPLSKLCHNHSYQYPKLPIIGLTYYESYQTGTFHNIVQSIDQLGNVPQCGATRSLPRQLWHGSPCPGCSGRGHPEPSFKAFLNHCAITLCPDSPGMGHLSQSFPEWWNQTTQANQGSLQGPTRKAWVGYFSV